MFENFYQNPQMDYYRQKAMGNFPQQYQYQPQIVAYTVSSIDEARVARIDNPMNTYIFLDTMNGKIYTKKIGDNGASILQAYSLDNPPTPISDAERIAALEKKIMELEGQKAAQKMPETKPEIKPEVLA